MRTARQAPNKMQNHAPPLKLHIGHPKKARKKGRMRQGENYRIESVTSGKTRSKNDSLNTLCEEQA